mmetsp:Transcript_109020/g.170441  ORF Transcript_109020/g.170441 Transcript_109020/m.170441 type:complete len:200 (-) Transcript_109020:10-609(-)
MARFQTLYRRNWRNWRKNRISGVIYWASAKLSSTEIFPLSRMLGRPWARKQRRRMLQKRLRPRARLMPKARLGPRRKLSPSLKLSSEKNLRRQQRRDSIGHHHPTCQTLMRHPSRHRRFKRRVQRARAQMRNLIGHHHRTCQILMRERQESQRRFRRATQMNLETSMQEWNLNLRKRIDSRASFTLISCSLSMLCRVSV